VNSAQPSAAANPGAAFVALYDRALPQVYGYLVRRVRNRAVAEDLTADTFLSAVGAVKRERVADPSIAWLITIARNKLVDHWRHEATEQAKLPLLHTDVAVEDEIETRFERERARAVLGRLGSHHRAALTLRYLDGLSVSEVAAALDRTVDATEALLVRARHAFRKAYQSDRTDADRREVR
jgi:RNA polymerase sigma-70 factor (ECF subfamily)